MTAKDNRSPAVLPDFDNKGARGKDKRGRGKGKIVALIIVGVFVLVGVASGIIIWQNMFGVRENIINPLLRNIPFVRDYIEPAVEEVAEVDPFNGRTREQMDLEIETLKLELEKKDKELADLQEKSDLYVKEITRLTEIEEQQLQFAADKAAFDSMIALNDPKAYEAFYKAIDPVNAEELYKQVIQTNAADARVTSFIASYSSMKPKEAAAIFEEMVKSDLGLIVGILERMNADQRGEILASLKPESAAIVTKRMSPF